MSSIWRYTLTAFPPNVISIASDSFLISSSMDAEDDDDRGTAGGVMALLLVVLLTHSVDKFRFGRQQLLQQLLAMFSR